MKYLLEAGLDEDTARQLLSELRRDNPYACRHPLDFAVEDTVTGRLRLPADALRHYRKRFAEAGLDIRRALENREVFADAWRTVCRRRREALLQEDLAAATGIHQEFAEAIANKDFDEADRLLVVMSRRQAIRPV